MINNQTSKEDVNDWFLENYKNWESHENIKAFLLDNLQLKDKLDDYYYSILIEKNKGNQDFQRLLKEMKVDVSNIEKNLTEDSFNMIEAIYWSIIEANTPQRIREVILNEMNKAKLSIEKENNKFPKAY